MTDHRVTRVPSPGVPCVEEARTLRTAGWVAGRLGISRWQVYELAKRGELPCVRLGRLVRFDEDAIEAFVHGGGTTNHRPTLETAALSPPRTRSRL